MNRRAFVTALTGLAALLGWKPKAEADPYPGFQATLLLEEHALPSVYLRKDGNVACVLPPDLETFGRLDVNGVVTRVLHIGRNGRVAMTVEELLALSSPYVRFQRRAEPEAFGPIVVDSEDYEAWGWPWQLAMPAKGVTVEKAWDLDSLYVSVSSAWVFDEA